MSPFGFDAEYMYMILCLKICGQSDNVCLCLCFFFIVFVLFFLFVLDLAYFLGGDRLHT